MSRTVVWFCNLMLPDSLLPPFIRREPHSQALVCEWREKSLAGTHCLHMISFLRIYENLEISVKSGPLHYPPQGILTSHVWKMPATEDTLCGRSMIRGTLCLQKLFMYSFKLNSCGTWLTQFFSLMLTDCLEQSNADRNCQSCNVPDFKTIRMSLTWEYNFAVRPFRR